MFKAFAIHKEMKKIIQILIIVTLISNNISAQFARFSDVSKEKYAEAELRKKNNVSRITRIEYSGSISSIDKQGQIKSVKEFDKNGDMVARYSKMNKGDSLYLRSRLEYDDSHRVTKIISYSENGIKQDSLVATFKDSTIQSEERFVNFTNSDYCLQSFQNGKLVYELSKKNGITKDSSHWQINTLGQRIKMEDYTNGKLNLIIEYENLTNLDYIERIFEANGKLRLKRYWKYDDQGNLLERIKYNSKEEVRTWYSYKYDCNGNNISAAVFDDVYKKLSFRDEKIYENNKLKEVIFFNSENIATRRINYFYDSNDMLFLEISETDFTVYKIEYSNKKIIGEL